MPLDDQAAKKFRLVGGDLCLDFCNTMGGTREGVARECLHSYADFLSWARQAGLVQETEAETLARKANRHSGEADRTLARCVELRETIYRIFHAIAQDKAPAAADLAHLNSELAQALGRLRVEPVAGPEKFAFKWANDAQALDHPLGPVVRSAAHLLTAPEVRSHVRQCFGDNCGWLFIDASKNHSRRWCDMRDCGNRAKVRRHRLKHRHG